MPFPTEGNLAPAFAELSQYRRDCACLTASAAKVLAEIRPALIGQRVRQFGRIWQIKQVDVRGNGVVSCYGVTVSKRGRVGTRGFDLGILEECEFIDGQGARKE